MRIVTRNIRLAVAAFAISCFAPAQASAQLDPKAIQSSVDIFNFGRIQDTYYRGALPDEDDVAALARLGVKTVIDLQKDGDEDEAGLVERAGMKYVRIPMTTRVAPTAEQLAQFLSLVNDPASQPVYVHCKEGRHRTGVMTAVYRMTAHGWNADQAFKEMKDYRFGWDFLHPEFKRFVYAYKPVDALVASDASAAAAVTAATD
jgi:tyrosine-protein phosphatase SIW14